MGETPAMSVSTEVQRTLVKSPPELWSELSNPEALARHLSELGEIRITAVEPETKVEWEAEGASGTVQLKQSGWGTKVTLSVTRIAPPGEQTPSEPEAAAEPEPVAEPEPAAATGPEPESELATPPAAAQPAGEVEPEQEAAAEPTAEPLGEAALEPVAEAKLVAAVVEPETVTEPDPRPRLLRTPVPVEVTQDDVCSPRRWQSSTPSQSQSQSQSSRSWHSPHPSRSTQTSDRIKAPRSRTGQ